MWGHMEKQEWHAPNTTCRYRRMTDCTAWWWGIGTTNSSCPPQSWGALMADVVSAACNVRINADGHCVDAQQHGKHDAVGDNELPAQAVPGQ